jgi:ribosome-binding factor A
VASATSRTAATMPLERSTRVRRVSEGVRVELAALFATEVKDPGVVGVIVTRVEMANDLKSARVYVRLLEGGDDKARRASGLEALGRASGMLRREVAQRLGLRYAPRLAFRYDEGVERSTRIESLLAEIEAERRSR